MPSPQSRYMIGLALMMVAGNAIGEMNWPLLLVIFLSGGFLCLRHGGQL